MVGAVPEYKECSKCKSTKASAEFSVDKKMRCGLNSMCRECVRQSGRRWKLANRERVLEYAKLWALKNPEKTREADRRRWETHKSRLKVRNAALRKANVAKYRLAKSAWKKANREKVAASARRAYAKDPVKDLNKCHRRRVRLLSAEGSFTSADVADIRRLQTDRCAICAIDLKSKGQIDHIVPLVAGGSNYRSNIQLLCRPCNASKGARDPVAYMRSIGRLI